eukprot:g8980.t1
MGGHSSRTAPDLPLPHQEVVSLQGSGGRVQDRPAGYLAAANTAARLAQKCETGQVKVQLAWLPHSFQLQKGPSRHLWEIHGTFTAEGPCTLSAHFHCRERTSSSGVLRYEAADTSGPPSWSASYPAGKHELRLAGDKAIDFQRWPLEVFWKLKHKRMDVIPVVFVLDMPGVQSIVHISLEVSKEAALNLQLKLLRQTLGPKGLSGEEDEIQLCISVQNVCCGLEKALQALPSSEAGRLADSLMATRDLTQLLCFAMTKCSSVARQGAEARIAKDVSEALVENLLYAELLWRVIRRTKPRSSRSASRASGASVRSRSQEGGLARPEADFPGKQAKLVQEVSECSGGILESSCAIHWGNLKVEDAKVTFSKFGLTASLGILGGSGVSSFELPWCCFELPDSWQQCSGTWSPGANPPPLDFRVDLGAAMVLCALSPALSTAIDHVDVMSLWVSNAKEFLPKLRSLIHDDLKVKVAKNKAALPPPPPMQVTRSRSRAMSEAREALRSHSEPVVRPVRLTAAKASAEKKTLVQTPHEDAAERASTVETKPEPEPRCGAAKERKPEAPPEPCPAPRALVRDPSPARSVRSVSACSVSSRVSLKEAAGLASEAANLGHLGQFGSEVIGTELISRLLIHRLTAPSPAPAGLSSMPMSEMRGPGEQTPDSRRKRLRSKSPARDLYMRTPISTPPRARVRSKSPPPPGSIPVSTGGPWTSAQRNGIGGGLSAACGRMSTPRPESQELAPRHGLPIGHGTPE